MNKGKIFAKRALYTICFILLGMIDFTRQTQGLGCWEPVVNCTGVLLLLIVLCQYKLREFVNLFSCIWSGISATALVFLVLYGDQHIFGVYKWTVVTAVPNIWLIGILGYPVAKKIFVEKTLRIKWNVTVVMAAAMTFFMMLSPYRAVWPIWFFFIFGLFYLTRFRREDFQTLLESMTDGIIIAFFILQIYAYGHRPFDTVRYNGAFANSNMTALHYLLTYAAVLFKLHFLAVKGGAKGWKLFFFIGAAGLLDFQLLTMSRTAWITSAVITVLYGFLVMKRLWKRSMRFVMGRGIALAACAIMLLPVVYATVRWLPPLRHHPIWYSGEWGVDRVHSFDPPDSEKYTDFDEFMEDLLKRLKILGFADNPLVLKARAAEKDNCRYLTLSGPENLTESLRIRLTIYKGYLEDLSWWGHGKYETSYMIKDPLMIVWHPQNVWIQVAYYYGIPAGILFLILSGLVMVRQIKAVMRDRAAGYTILPLFVSIVFFMYGMMEVVWLVGQLILFLFLFLQHPQFESMNLVSEGAFLYNTGKEAYGKSDERISDSNHSCI